MTADDTRPTKPKNRSCLIAIGVLLLFLVLLVIIALILAFTVFKPKQPRTQILSAAVDGAAPRISFPAIQVELNITLDLMLLVQNRNHASFKHGAGKSFILYQGKQVGDADLYPGLIPARANATLPCRLTVQADRLASDMSHLINDLLSGKFVMETRTVIPGRITFLGFIKKHVEAVSECKVTIGFPNMKVRSQVCKSKTNF